MAVFYPTLEQIKNDKMEKHTAGEMSLLKELTALPDDFNVYFQPHINFAHPDVVIESAGRGILIIEVKDWDLSAYHFHEGHRRDKFGYLTVQGGNDAHLSTPFEQVQSYKDELYELLSSELCAAYLQNERVTSEGEKKNVLYGVVRVGVYFTGASAKTVQETFSDNTIKFKYNRMYYDKHIACITKDDSGHIASIVREILRENRYYTKAIHEDMAALFTPSMEWREQSETISLTHEQERFAQCINDRIRIKGTPGSGKTIILARKAINCYRAKGEPVLILTYNITLKNYIHDKIAVNSRDMSGRERSNAFEIIHLDQFLTQVMRKYGLKDLSIDGYKSRSGLIAWDKYRRDQMAIIQSQSSLIRRYSTVLIDEAQDFSYDWFRFIDAVFVADNADYLVVADEKQNIYGRESDNQRLPRVSGFNGPWTTLKGNYRMTAAGYNLAVSFQQEYMKGKYTIDEPIQEAIPIENRKCLRLDTFDPERIYTEVQSFTHGDSPISPNDICILASSIEDVRAIDKSIRTHDGSRSTLTVCETQEWYEKLRKNHGVDEPGITREEEKERKESLKADLNKIRHVKRFAFYMNSGTIKISTVHSFKGWEIDTVVLVIHETEQAISPEVIYTAITRTKRNLLVIICGNNNYYDFFSRRLASAQ